MNIYDKIFALIERMIEWANPKEIMDEALREYPNGKKELLDALRNLRLEGRM